VVVIGFVPADERHGGGVRLGETTMTKEDRYRTDARFRALVDRMREYMDLGWTASDVYAAVTLASLQRRMMSEERSMRPPDDFAGRGVVERGKAQNMNPESFSVPDPTLAIKMGIDRIDPGGHAPGPRVTDDLSRGRATEP
jgi:hypothetical protein